MSDGAGVEVRGLDQLAAAAGQVGAGIEKGAQKAFEGFAQPVADRVRASVPRISGDMAASVTVEQVTDGVTVGYDGSAIYAGWVDFGGSRRRPLVAEGRYLFPVAKPAGEQLEGEAARFANDEIGRASWPRA